MHSKEMLDKLGGDFLEQPAKRTLHGKQPQVSTLTHADLQGSLLQLGAMLGHAHTASDDLEE